MSETNGPAGWQPIETAPKDGTEIIVLIDCASVPIVRTAWWSDVDLTHDGKATPDEIGWWSYRHSVTQEMLEGHEEPRWWMPMPDMPEDWPWK